jgi:hypothetical protein
MMNSIQALIASALFLSVPVLADSESQNGNFQQDPQTMVEVDQWPAGVQLVIDGEVDLLKSDHIRSCVNDYLSGQVDGNSKEGSIVRLTLRRVNRTDGALDLEVRGKAHLKTLQLDKNFINGQKIAVYGDRDAWEPTFEFNLESAEGCQKYEHGVNMKTIDFDTHRIRDCIKKFRDEADKL